MKNLCPCYSGQPYTVCCQPLLEGQAAPDAERLMRSRYSAYVMKLSEYILETWHPDTRPEKLTLDDLNGIKWMKLQVKTHRQLDDTHAEVEFSATYQNGNQKKLQLSEHSQFVRMNDRWLYVGERQTQSLD